MKETVLLFEFEEEKQKKVIRNLLPLRLRIKKVEPGQYGQRIGMIAGAEMENSEEAEEQKTAENMKMQREMLGDEMLVMAGLSSARVDAVLMALRKARVGAIPYKAVMTTANQQWNAYELLAELKQEHVRFEGEKHGDRIS